MSPAEPRPFEKSELLDEWLRANHATERELWVRVFKKASGTPTVTWDDCVVAAITWGWIDGQRKAHDDVSLLQRLTPRRPRSGWSTRNRDHAERLIADGRMRPSGLAHVLAAREDGRWARAYSGSADMVMPDDFLVELRTNPAAERVFAEIDREKLYAIDQRVQSARQSETRKKRIADSVAQLAGGETPRPLLSKPPSARQASAAQVSPPRAARRR